MDSRRQSDSRPAGNGPATKSLASTADSIVTTDRLWRFAEECPPESIRWLGIGYQLGLLERDGYADGYSDAARHMADRWHKVYVQVQAMAKQPTFAELRRRRGEVA